MEPEMRLLTALELVRTPGSIRPRNSAEAVLVEDTPTGGSPRASHSGTSTPIQQPRLRARGSKSRRALMPSLRDDANSSYLEVLNSGSELDSDDSDEEVVRSVRKDMENGLADDGENEDLADEGVEGIQGVELPEMPQEDAGFEEYSWSEDFSTFSAMEETYLRTPGPCIAAHDPVDVFKKIWDERIMNLIVEETNRYARQRIEPYSEVEGGMPAFLDDWYETTTDEMYRYFAVLILMSLCYRARVGDYWTTGILEMQNFRKVMSRSRFVFLTRFLHFVDNEESYDPSLTSYEKKISKVRPILDHCNKKFREIYTPNKHLSLDESLLLWKGRRLSWVQCIRTKAARFGIKSYELCEAETGYQLRCLLYAGKNSTMHEKPLHGFDNATAKVVLELMDGYLDVGHTLVMDNWYNRLSLTRFLKRRGTDVIGTLNPRSVGVPDAIKHAGSSRLARGEQIARHCGDISLIAWQDVKLVTALSTYHKNGMSPGRRAGRPHSKPVAIATYNKYMGGVDSKDQKLSMYLMERKRGLRWYMKVFKRLLNTSLLNAYIIHRKTPSTARTLSHREFRTKVALDLLDRHQKPGPIVNVTPTSTTNVAEKRLQLGNHFVAPTELRTGGGRQHRLQKRCARCLARGKRTMVCTICTLCDVPLCIGTCWAEYHTLRNLH